MFRPFLDTSFFDYRQARIVLQELSYNQSKQLSADFQKFCTYLFEHKNFRYEQFQTEYCFVKKSLIQAESSLADIQLYRRPFGYIFFTVCYTSSQLRTVLDEYYRIKQKEKGVFMYLFVRYKTLDNDDQDDLSNDEIFINGLYDDPDDMLSKRPSLATLSSIDSYQSLRRSPSFLKVPDAQSNDGSGSIASDRTSPAESLNEVPLFNPTSNDTPDDDDEGINGGGINTPRIRSASKLSLFKDKTMQTTTLFDSFDADLTRIYHRLEASLSKCTSDSKRLDTFISSIDSQLADIRLMIACEKDCSLLETEKKFQNTLNEFDMQIMLVLLNQYIKANTNLTNETGKNKLAKKLLDARTIKRKGDCCLLFGATDKAYHDYRRAADALKTQNDQIWHAAALEARVAASYSSSQKPKRNMQRVVSFLRERTLTRRLSVEKYLSRSNTPLYLQDKMEIALQIYNTENRTRSDKVTHRIELDACLRWCSLLWEQNDPIKYQGDIDQFITRINRLGSYLHEHIDSINLNAYLAETYAFIGSRRKSALYYRSAAYSGLVLLDHQEDYNDEIPFFSALIKQACKGYGIDDNQLIFPLIQKTVINESIRISLKNDDFTTIIENIHFAIESLIEYMTDNELTAILTFLKASQEIITCSYCSIPRLKSLDLLPSSNHFKVWKSEQKSGLFIYQPKSVIHNQHKSLHRKVDFFWVKNEPVQIAIEVENYLPATMFVDQLEFVTDLALLTKLETKYQIPARTTKRLLIDCIPKEIGQLKIQGLRYHIWSTNQEFRFGDFPSIRHCTCSVDVVDQLPILDVNYFSINDTKLDLTNSSTGYNAQIYRGEDVFVTFGLKNSSNECPINSFAMEVFVFGVDMSEYINVDGLNLPILISKSIEVKIDISEIYDRYFSRQYRPITNVDVLKVEFRLNYSNDLSINEGHHRRYTIELSLNYLSPVTFQINDIQNDENDLFYLMCCTIDNHLSEEILFGNDIIKPSETSLISIKQNKIKLNTFPSDRNQLITDIRTQLPTHIKYKTNTSNKQLRLPIDLQYFSDEIIQNHLNILLQTPYTCYWHFQKIHKSYHIRLSVTSKCFPISKLEFLFSSTNRIQYLNSNKILFNNLQPNEYSITERILIFSQENSSNVLTIDVNVNDIPWKKLNFTMENEQFQIII